MVIGRDIRTPARLESAAGLAERIDRADPHALPDDLAGYAVVVLDLDETGIEPAAALRAAGFEGRVVGFYSHVDEALGRRAAAAQIEAFRRGRFWREAAAILG